MSIVSDEIRGLASTVGQEENFRSVAARMRGVGHLLTSHSFPLHKNESIEPFFIVGSGRCGTTLLRRLLQASPKVHIPPENWTFGACLADFRAYRVSLPWRTLVDSLLCRHVVENHRWFDDIPDELRRTLHELEDSQRSLARFYDEVYRYHGRCREATFERWGDKTPANVWKMEELLAVFPSARFIHLLRDGVDVVHSGSKIEKYQGEVVRPAKRWVSAVTTAREFAERHPDRLLTVRYERMCRAPEDVLQKVCEFVDVSYSPRLIAREGHYGELQAARSIPHYEKVFGEISTDSIGKGRKNMSSAEKDKVRPHIDEVLQSEGYNPIG